LQRAFATCGLEVSIEACSELLTEYALERMAAGETRSPIALGGAARATRSVVEEPDSFFGKGATGGVTEAWPRSDRAVFDAVAGDLLIDLGYEPDHSWAGSVAHRRWYAARMRAHRALGRLRHRA
jgi:hypothetical protein